MIRDADVRIRLIERCNWREDRTVGYCDSIERAHELMRAWRDGTASRIWIEPKLVMDLPIIVFELTFGEDRNGKEFLSLKEMSSWMRSDRTQMQNQTD
jgi:hypothetical protein